MTKEKEQPTEKKEFPERAPVFSTRIRMSKDGQWILIDSIRRDIIHRNYMDAVLRKSG